MVIVWIEGFFGACAVVAVWLLLARRGHHIGGARHDRRR